LHTGAEPSIAPERKIDTQARNKVVGAAGVERILASSSAQPHGM
jgi:hypothetical protein